MFPQLIAGPIVRFKDIHQQLLGFSKNKFDQKLHGLYRFVIGLSKKVLIANTCALVVAQVNGLGTDAMTSADAWMATFAYCFQIYFDFAGYSDMAIGLGLMMGFQFPENFNFPYLAMEEQKMILLTLLFAAALKTAVEPETIFLQIR